MIIGHSLGGLVVAAGLPVLRPRRAVYVDVPFALSPRDGGRQALAAELARRKAGRTLEALRRDRPGWGERDLLAAAQSRARWDVATSTSVLVDAAGRDLTPDAEIPSLVVRAQHSDCVPGELAIDLARRRFTVRTVAGAGHTVWAGRCAAFLTALAGWVDDPPRTRAVGSRRESLGVARLSSGAASLRIDKGFVDDDYRAMYRLIATTAD